MLADTLFDEGYQVVEAANVLEDVAMLGQRNVDAVVTDVDMPGGLNDLDLAKMISVTHTCTCRSSSHRADTASGRKNSLATPCSSRSHMVWMSSLRWWET